MMPDEQRSVTLRTWSEEDFSLLVRLMGDPAMTVYLQGPETMEQLEKRHARYCGYKTSDKNFVYVVLYGDQPVGSVGYWETEWEGQPAWEAFWSVVPEFQGKGIATRAMALVIEHARAQARHPYMHAMPSVDNAASNAVCRKAGFVLQGEIELEAWREPGKYLRFNNWRLTLFAEPSASPPR